MKKTAVLAGVIGAASAAAFAPEAAAQVYAGAGYTIVQGDVGGEDVNIGAVMGRAGFKTNPFFGVEGEVAIGVQEDDFNVLGTEVNVGLDSHYGVFAVGWLPVPLVGDLFARVGYADSTIEAEATGIGSLSEDGAGMAYGAGFQFSQFPFTQLRVEYTRYEPDDGEFDSIGVSALFQF